MALCFTFNFAESFIRCTFDVNKSEEKFSSTFIVLSFVMGSINSLLPLSEFVVSVNNNRANTTDIDIFRLSSNWFNL